MKAVDAEFVDEVIVTCSGCSQKNRLYKRAQLGIHRCGRCRAPLSAPINSTQTEGSRWRMIAWLSGCAVILFIIFAARPNKTPSDPAYYSNSSGDGLPTSYPPVSVSEERPATIPTQPLPKTKFNSTPIPNREPTAEFQRNSDGSFSLPPTALTEDARRAIAVLKQRGSRVNAESLAFEIARAKANQATPAPIPANGEIHTYTNQAGVAPFAIKSTRGTNYLVKLVTLSGQQVLTVFVHGGETVSVNVPLGTYVVKYATGNTWYGYDALFGPNTSYSRATTNFTFQATATAIEGYTITLYTVPFGNLHMEHIKSEEF